MQPKAIPHRVDAARSSEILQTCASRPAFHDCLWALIASSVKFQTLRSTSGDARFVSLRACQEGAKVKSALGDNNIVYTITKISGTTVTLTEDTSRARAKSKMKAPVGIAVDTSVLADLYEADPLLHNDSLSQDAQQQFLEPSLEPHPM